ncbi:MAG: DNA polymerase III subunit gamma/tau [Eubacteriales bacterium]
MHQALYRKWRPRTFSEVVGQDHITKVLAHEAEEGRLNHAYLFCGSRGTGKTTCAKILAKAANCKHLTNGNPCNECETCRAIDSGASLDVLEMDAASNTGVDYIRDIREEVIFTPSEMGTRVYIIDEVHMLSEGAFNALLKTLEEPPSRVIFILATTELQKIPATILSRCQRFDFRRIPVVTIMERLAYIAENEGIDLTEDGARLIAKLSQGGMRDAVSLLELCSADGQSVTAERVGEISGVVGRAGVTKVVEAIRNHDFRTIFEEVARIHRSSCDLAVFLNDLAAFYRDMMVRKALGIKTANEVSKEILDVSDSELSDLIRLSSAFRYGTLVYHSKLLESACLSMSRGADKRITAEVTLIRMCGEATGDSNEALSAKIDELEEKLTALMVSGVTAVPSSEPVSVVAKVKEETPTTKASDSREIPERTEPALVEYTGFADLIDQFEKIHMAETPYLRKAKAMIDPVGRRLYVNLTDSFALTMLEAVHGAEALTALSRSVGDPLSQVIFRVRPRETEKNSLLDDLL